VGISRSSGDGLKRVAFSERNREWAFQRSRSGTSTCARTESSRIGVRVARSVSATASYRHLRARPWRAAECYGTSISFRSAESACAKRRVNDTEPCHRECPYSGSDDCATSVCYATLAGSSASASARRMSGGHRSRVPIVFASSPAAAAPSASPVRARKAAWSRRPWARW
jgi:hypothetical protein